MQNITSIAGLRDAIQLLEIERAKKGILLKEQFYLTYESLKPVNLLKNTLKEIFLSPNLIDNFLGTIIGLGSGYLSKKIVVGGSGNIIKKLLGSILQFGVTNMVAQHPDGIKALGQLIFQRIFSKRERTVRDKEE
jgi:hypothetical protein